MASRLVPVLLRGFSSELVSRKHAALPSGDRIAPLEIREILLSISRTARSLLQMFDVRLVLRTAVGGRAGELVLLWLLNPVRTVVGLHLSSVRSAADSTLGIWALAAPTPISFPDSVADHRPERRLGETESISVSLSATHVPAGVTNRM